MEIPVSTSKSPDLLLCLCSPLKLSVIQNSSVSLSVIVCISNEFNRYSCLNMTTQKLFSDTSAPQLAHSTTVPLSAGPSDEYDVELH